MILELEGLKIFKIGPLSIQFILTEFRCLQLQELRRQTELRKSQCWLRTPPFAIFPQLCVHVNYRIYATPDRYTLCFQDQSLKTRTQIINIIHSRRHHIFAKETTLKLTFRMRYSSQSFRTTKVPTACTSCRKSAKCF